MKYKWKSLTGCDDFSKLFTLVISHLHYPATLLNGSTETTENLNTTIGKQLNWVIKLFQSNKQDRSSDLKIKHNTLPIRCFLENNSLSYFWKWKKPNPGFPIFITGHWQNTKTIQNRESSLQ